MELMPGYKKTEIGVIPEDWETIELGNAADFLNSQRRPIKDADRAKMKGEYPYYGAAGIVGYVNKFIFDDDLVLIGEDGENILSRNLPVAFRVSGKCWVNNHAHVLKTKEHVDPNYFAMACAELDLAAHNSGTAQPKITKATCRRLTIPLPTLAEQKAIAEALSDADASIAALSRLVAKKRDLRRGAMQRLLTGRTRLPGFTEPWQEKRLGELVIARTDKVNGSTLPKGTPCVELDQIDPGSGQLIAIGSASSTSVKNLFEVGDVLFGRLRAYLRKFWLADRNGVCSTEIWPLVPIEGKAISGFVFYTVQRYDFIGAASQSYGTHMPRSDWGVVKNFEVLTPSLDEQTAIARVLSDMDAEIAALEARLAKTRALKKAMMQALLTGRVRLPFDREAPKVTKEPANA
jgi:type I restriction enzyme S subunit